MLLSRVGIFWSAVRYPIAASTIIVFMAVKLLKSIIENADCSLYDMIPTHELSCVRGSRVFHIQDILHTERDKKVAEMDVRNEYHNRCPR